MNALLDIALTNALMAGALAVVAIVLVRTTRRPALAHVLWALVLIRLVMPPIVPVEVLPVSAFTDEASAEDDSVPLLDRFPTSPVPASWATEEIEEPSDVEVTPVTTVLDENEGTTPLALVATAEPPLLPRWGWAWAIGSAVVLVLALVRARRFHGIVSRARPSPEPIQDLARTIAKRLGIRRYPDVVLVDAAVPPLVWGFLCRARIVLPSRLLVEIDGEELHGLLAHELAHVRRRDHWMRYIELVATAAWWWLPLTWWARRRLREAEELCCDRWAVWCAPAAREAYATALLRTVTFLSRTRGRTPAPAVGMSAIPGVKRRLGMILETQNGAPVLRRTTLLVCLALPVFALLPAQAVSEPEPAKLTVEPTKPVSTLEPEPLTQERPQEKPTSRPARATATKTEGYTPSIAPPIHAPGLAASIDLQNRLNTTTMSVQLEEATLKEFVKLLSSKGGMSIVIEPEVARHKMNEVITLDLENVSLRVALDTVCKTLEIHPEVDHGILRLTQESYVRVYDVKDITGDAEATKQLARMVKRNVSPKTWMKPAYDVTPSKTVLIVKAPKAIDRQVRQFITDLRAFSTRRARGHADDGSSPRSPWRNREEESNASSEALLRQQIEELKARQRALRKRIESLHSGQDGNSQPDEPTAGKQSVLRLTTMDPQGRPLKGIGVQWVNYRTEKRDSDGRLISVHETRDKRKRWPKSGPDGRLQIPLRPGRVAHVRLTDGKGGHSDLRIETGSKPSVIEAEAVFETRRTKGTWDRNGLLKEVIELPNRSEFDELRKPEKKKVTIRGKVLGGEFKNDHILLNVGSEAGVKKGTALEVIRGNKYIGRLLVAQVGKKQSLAELIMAVSNDRPKPGDTVLNNLR